MKRVSIKHLLISIILILALVLSSGCLLTESETPAASESETTSTSTSPPAENGDHIDPDWVLPESEGDAPALLSIADVVAEVRPSVVAINVEATAYDFFNRPYTEEGAGSGWIIDENGIIVTNNHVVTGAEAITVTLADDRIYSVDTSTVATDQLTDLAVFEIDAANLTALNVGDSAELRVGDWVVAIGNALGERISATTGIVSAAEVSLQMSEGQTLYDLIQTDAAINPGNSGGPLVNISGEVVGITSAKIAEVGVEGMGYAISINSALPIIQDLVTTGYVIRPWLGVAVYPVSEGLASFYGFAVNEGALLTEISAGSPADLAGLELNDIIVGFDNEEITTTDDLIQAIRASQIGQQVKITFWRGETRYTTYATLIENPPST